jgi:hypothetical protein
MPRGGFCADHLILLGEMLEASNEYLHLCDTGMEGEPLSMIALAYDQLHSLSQRSARLSAELTELENRMRRKMFIRGGGETDPAKLKVRSARSGK